MTPRETDPAVRRLERYAVWACLAMALVALVVRGGRPDVALGPARRGGDGPDRRLARACSWSGTLYSLSGRTL